ncbi:MAG TPA: EAL domain-containing protein, partial [Pseudonocardiaceae bacterium]|nr:EAL domain-containing protein [Pseudonocardiaceae bacterium]
MTSGNPIDIEYRVLRSDGSVRIVQGLAEAKRDSAGRLVRYTGSIRDITEQRQAERALAQERARLLEAQRISLMGSWSVEVASGRLEFSEALIEMLDNLGVDAYTDAMASVHPADRAQLRGLLPRLAALGPDGTVEVEFRGPPHTERTFLVRARAERDGAGQIVRILGTVQDVTEQRAAETRMRRSTQRFADLVSIAPVGIGLFDDADRLVDANDALCKLLGRPLSRLRGRTFAQLTHRAAAGPQLPSIEELAGVEDYTVPQVALAHSEDRMVSCELHVSVSEQDDGRRFRLVVFSDITERLRAAEILRHQATHDDLTGLPNRSAVKELIGELLAGPARQRVAVLFCDIDNFKRVNDSLGHDAGDELLVALARRLVDGLPECCTAARLSGDEYLVICRDTEQVGGVGQLVGTVSGLLRAAIPLRGQIVLVSATVGASMPGGPQTEPEDLLRFADAAMYQAKDAGRGRVALASAALMASADHQVELEGQLRDALANDELALEYQPVVGPDGRIETAEALVRWPHRDRGMLSPEVFLPVAEQGDLLRELDTWVLRAALREAASWSKLGTRRVSVAVNLAGLVPGDVDFVDAVSAAVTDSGIDWDQVVLELVETALVDLPSRARMAMAELVDRGMRFAVDDFGTGYSSLARLRELPAQIIKVDRQFVAGVGSDPLDLAVARAVVDMAKAMDRQCVAEGVETAAQFNVLRGLEVDAYQGFLFSRPLPPRELRDVLAQGALDVPGTG